MLLVVGFATIAFAVSLLPKQAHAFWFFSAHADAAVNTIIPSSSTPTLSAPTNSNPNVSAPITLATSGESALLPYSGPSGAVANVNNVVSDRISVYVVRPGDTMSDIATMFDVSVNTIVWANNLKSVRDMHPGDILVILPVSGIERTVVKGDTLKSLAKKYGADADEIATFNGLDSVAPLAIGTTIIIPGGEISVPTQQPSRSTSKPIKNPYTGSGVAFLGYFSNPIPGVILTQGVHGFNGVDLGAARGTPIYAAADGIAIIARGGSGWNGGYGNYIVITHDNNSQTLYAHMRSIVVSYGQSISQGQLIGYVGSTGRSSGPHLHFEVRGAKNPFASCALRSVCSPE